MKTLKWILSGIFLATGASHSADEKLNVLFIISDDLTATASVMLWE